MQPQSPDLALWLGSPAASQHARTLAVRIVALDYHYARPLPGLDPAYIPRCGTPIPKLCVLRVFGATPSGQKACVHIHQVLCFRFLFWEHLQSSSCAKVRHVRTIVRSCALKG